MEDWNMKCPACGPQEFLLFDASHVLERAFEGCWFKVVRGPNDEPVISLLGEDEDAYFDDFNMVKHFETARKIAEEMGGTELCCPRCKEIMGYPEGEA